MRDFILTTPVALLVFNRPELTAQVFAAIREARPAQLLLIADGPRPDRSDDIQKCAEVLNIVEQIDWPCKVFRNHSKTNLGCKLRVSSGLDWVFNQVEEAIILEDDCLPNMTFFRFCQEMLERYRDDHRIASIGGSNYQFSSRDTTYSYYFSIYNHIWGWASWKRAWLDYDLDISEWLKVRKTDWLSKVFTKRSDINYWKSNFDKAYNNQIDTWDIQWTFACWLNNRLSIIPCVNLVSNIGFGSSALHTIDATSHLASIPTRPMKFPLIHPPFVIRDAQSDAVTQKNVFNQNILKNLVDAVTYMFRRNI